jgi:hypothetical protein
MRYAAALQHVTKLPGSASRVQGSVQQYPQRLHPAKPAMRADASALHQAVHAPAMARAPQFAAVPQVQSCDAKMADMWRSRPGSAAGRRVGATASAAPDRWCRDPIRRCATFVPDTTQHGPTTNFRNDPHPHSVLRPRTAGRTLDRPPGTACSLRCRAAWCHRSRRSRHAAHPASSPRPLHVPRVPRDPRAPQPCYPRPGASPPIAPPIQGPPMQGPPMHGPRTPRAPAAAAAGQPARPPAPHWRPIRSAIARQSARPSPGHAACRRDFAQPPRNA